ncbi:hypothetical protein D3C83_204730 [compost metagenome]
MHEVVHVLAGDGLVRRDYDDVKLVDVPEFARFGFGGTGHACQLVVHPEVVLEGDGRVGLRSVLNLHVLLRFDSLV